MNKRVSNPIPTGTKRPAPPPSPPAPKSANIDLRMYDKNRREIKIGDVLKVFHFTARQRRKKHYMYKLVVESFGFGDGDVYMKISHLDSLDNSTNVYAVCLKGQILDDYEIVQSAIDEFSLRPKKPRKRIE